MRVGLKGKGRFTIISLMLIFGFVNETIGQIIKTNEHRRLEAIYLELKQEYDACFAENEKLKDKNDSLLLSTKVISMKTESLHAFEAKFKPEIPGGYIDYKVNPKVLASMNRFGDMESYIEKILYNAGFNNGKRFIVNGGFGIASDIERIKIDWTSEDSLKRFDLTFDYSTSEGNWLERFLFPRSAGRTRMFLFIVSNQAFDGKGEKHNLDAIMEWLDFGFSSLLLQIANTKIDSTFKMHVLVYEYEVTDMNSKGKLNKSELKVIDHLKKAKLWQSEMGI